MSSGQASGWRFPGIDRPAVQTVIGWTLMGLAARMLWACLLWSPAFRNAYDPPAVRAIETAYAVAVGHGFTFALPGSPARNDLELLRNRAEIGGEHLTMADYDAVSDDGQFVETMYPPGYSVLGGLLHRWTGVPVWLILQSTGVLLDTLAIPLVYAIVFLALANHRLALGTAAMYALFPPLLYNAATIYPMAIAAPLVIVATWCVLVSTRHECRRQWLWLGAGGVMLGLAAYFRSDYLLLGAAFVPGLWHVRGRLLRALLGGAVVTGAALVVLLPWAVRNYQICGRPVLTGSCVGAVLVTGLGAHPNPWGFGRRDEDRMREATAVGIDNPFDCRGDLHFRQVFFDAVRSDPVAYVKILLRRTVETILPAHEWGLKVGGDESGSKLRAEGNLLSKLPTLIKSFWPRLISAGLMAVASACCAVMLVREWRRSPAVALVLTVPLYAALSHIATMVMPLYLIPGVFAQLLGLVYVGLLGIDRIRGRTSVAPSATTEEAA